MPRCALAVWHAEGGASKGSPGPRRGTEERSSDTAQGAPQGAESSLSRLSTELGRGGVEPAKGFAHASRWDTAEPGVGGVQPHMPDVDASPNRLGSGSRRETAERGRVSCLCIAGIQGTATPLEGVHWHLTW